MDSPTGPKPPDGGGPKRRRRKRGGARGSERTASDEPRGKNPQNKGRDKQQRGRGGRRPSNRAARTLSKRSKPVDLDKSADDPLTKQEVAVLREHFRFLRENRKELRLKVNANEDLLLNGVREPVHRGVCRHLLGKVERSNVLAAAERLEPARAARLLAGIIGFSSDIEYVLLFLEKIQQSASPTDATTALFQGLRRIEFDTVSSAQMRRVLQLTTDLFDETQRPALLLGMLESASFRSAFDKSIPDLPEALSHLVLPLRAAQSVILRGQPNAFDSRALCDGVNLLLDLDSKILLRHSTPMRERLFDYGLQACGLPEHPRHDRLKMLLRHFSPADPKNRQRAIALAAHLIAANAETDARQQLQALVTENPDFDLPARWLAILDAERLGRIALLEQPPDRTDVLGQNTWRAGTRLDSMRPVWVQIARPETISNHDATRNLLDEIAVQGVASVLESGTTQAGEPYFVVANIGPSLDHALLEKLDLDLAAVLRICHEVVGLLNSLAAVGVLLPDVELTRFALEPSGAVELTDLAGARRVEPDVRGGSAFELARSCCSAILDRARCCIVPAEVRAVVSDATSCAELARGLSRSRR